MEQVKEVLTKLHSILKCRVALQREDQLVFYPPSLSAEEELGTYRPYELKLSDSTYTLYVEKGKELIDATLALVSLYLEEKLCGEKSLEKSFLKLLLGTYDYEDQAALSIIFSKEKPLQLILISGTALQGAEAELVEVISNSIDVILMTPYQDHMVVLIKEQNTLEACSNLQKNILTELYMEVVIAIGGAVEEPKQLSEQYSCCLEAMQLKNSYHLNLKLLDYQSMLLYRMVSSMNSKLKQETVERIFHNSFTQLLNAELELTIEEMFKNNLNLTDTAARLYIHRNTLLYRIDKIYKMTGFDLRRFEDSMLFKLAWLMYKENR